jgi:hypothetical protein
LGNDIVTIQRNGTIRTIIVAKHLRGEVKRLEVLLCYDYQNGIIDEEKDIIFVIELVLFSIGTISLLATIQYLKTTNVGIMDTYVKTNISKQGYKVQSIKKKILGNSFEPKVAFEDKVYLERYYKHQPWNVIMDETLANMKAQGLQIIGWMLTKD